MDIEHNSSEDQQDEEFEIIASSTCRIRFRCRSKSGAVLFRPGCIFVAINCDKL